MHKHLTKILWALLILEFALIIVFSVPGKVETYERPPTPKEYAQILVEERWGEHEWEYFDLIMEKESNWTHTAQNPTSTAYGIAQFLDSTWATVGCEKTEDPYVQVDCAVEYIDQRYKTPRVAWHHHIVKNFY